MSLQWWPRDRFHAAYSDSPWRTRSWRTTSPRWWPHRWRSSCSSSACRGMTPPHPLLLLLLRQWSYRPFGLPPLRPGSVSPRLSSSCVTLSTRKRGTTRSRRLARGHGPCYRWPGGWPGARGRLPTGEAAPSGHPRTDWVPAVGEATAAAAARCPATDWTLGWHAALVSGWGVFHQVGQDVIPAEDAEGATHHPGGGRHIWAAAAGHQGGCAVDTPRQRQRRSDINTLVSTVDERKHKFIIRSIRSLTMVYTVVLGLMYKLQIMKVKMYRHR